MDDNKKNDGIINEYRAKQKISEEDLIDHLLDNEEDVKYDRSNRSVAFEILMWFRDFAIIIVIFFLFTSFVSERTVVEGSSMEPAISEGDWIYINKFVYNFKDPSRYDIIVFVYAGDRKKNYIKRVIGLPGDEIRVVRNEGVYVNGELLDEDYGLEVINRIGNQSYPVIVPEDSYFVLGDNRNNSHDSRSVDVGMVPKKDIAGRAGLRVWPISDFGLIN